MPNGIIPNEGLAAVLERILNPAGASPANWRAVLWVNDFTPDFDTELADLTQASFGGYLFATLTAAHWTAPTVLAGCAQSTWKLLPISWTVTDPAGQTPFGWAMLDPTAGSLRFVQRFEPADIVALAVGDVLRLLPTFCQSSASCSAFTVRRRRLPKKER